MRRLILFAKRPRPGKVKTRLVPHFTVEQVLELYRAFLEDQLRFLRSFSSSYDVELCLDGPWSPGGELAELVSSLPTAEQGPGNLGDRLSRAFRRSVAEGSEAAVVMGSDSPTLPASRVTDAFRALDRGARAVVADADDGGYVLIGLRGIADELFEEIPWGGPEVLRRTVERAKAIGCRLDRLAPWYDVDEPVALRRLIRELRRPEARRRAPATAAAVDRLALGDPPTGAGPDDEIGESPLVDSRRKRVL